MAESTTPAGESGPSAPAPAPGGPCPRPRARNPGAPPLPRRGGRVLPAGLAPRPAPSLVRPWRSGRLEAQTAPAARGAPGGSEGAGASAPTAGPRRDGPRGGRDFRTRRKVCIFCVEKTKEIDCKDTARLRRFLSDRGKIEPRRKTGTCAKHQRRLSTALKRARYMALLPFTGEHIRNIERAGGGDPARGPQPPPVTREATPVPVAAGAPGGGPGGVPAPATAPAPAPEAPEAIPAPVAANGAPVTAAPVRALRTLTPDAPAPASASASTPASAGA